jgi:hypothetical protein
MAAQRVCSPTTRVAATSSDGSGAPDIMLSATTTTIIAPRDALTDAIRYWERGRIFYNLALAAIVAGYFVAGWPLSATHVGWDLAQQLFLLGVLANIAYCAAYVPDLLMQLSDVRSTWLRVRWMLFAIGLAFAAIIARFIAMALFGIPW